MIEHHPNHHSTIMPEHLEQQADNTTYVLSPGTTLVWDYDNPLKLDVPVLRGCRAPSMRKGPRHMKPKRRR